MFLVGDCKRSALAERIGDSNDLLIQPLGLGKNVGFITFILLKSNKVEQDITFIHDHDL